MTRNDVTNLFEAGGEGEVALIAGEDAAGPSLADWVEAHGPLSGADLDRLAVSTLTALVILHRGDTAHLGFAPTAVMMAPGSPRMMHAAGEDPVTERASYASAYVAPEQVRGEPGGSWSDVFSWASTMVFATTGHNAFSASNPTAQKHKILYRDADLIAVPMPLATVLTDCLRKDPAERPTADEALARLLAELRPSTSGDEGPGAQKPGDQGPDDEEPPDVLVQARGFLGEGSFPELPPADRPVGRATPSSTSAPPAPRRPDPMSDTIEIPIAEPAQPDWALFTPAQAPAPRDLPGPPASPPPVPVERGRSRRRRALVIALALMAVGLLVAAAAVAVRFEVAQLYQRSPLVGAATDSVAQASPTPDATPTTVATATGRTSPVASGNGPAPRRSTPSATTRSATTPSATTRTVTTRRAATRPVTTRTATTQPATARPASEVLPAAFGGTWQGLVSQPSVTPARFPVVLSLTAGSAGGTLTLPSIGCRGTITLSQAVTNPRQVSMAETVVRNPGGRCARAAQITLTQAENEKIRFRWQDAADAGNVAVGILTRR